ncbi:hypothetical protein Tco_0813052 [Tanacetum coccineum]
MLSAVRPQSVQHVIIACTRVMTILSRPVIMRVRCTSGLIELSPFSVVMYEYSVAASHSRSQLVSLLTAISVSVLSRETRSCSRMARVALSGLWSLSIL